MKKILEFFKSFLGSVGGDFAIDQLSDLLEKGLDKFYEKDPAKCIALVQSLYAWLPTLTELAKETGTNLDDKAVAELKDDFEAFAKSKGIELPVLPAPAPTPTGGSDPEPGGEDDENGGQG